MQVLYRFLEFFSSFDWDNFCVSLWGPVPISSLPDVTGNLLQNCCFKTSSFDPSQKLLANFLVLMFSYWKYFTAEPPRQDSGELLLSKLFLDACSSVYAVFPHGQEKQGQSFISKHFNVIDPLRVNNNLGRSVSKGIQTLSNWYSTFVVVFSVIHLYFLTRYVMSLVLWCICMVLLVIS